MFQQEEKVQEVDAHKEKSQDYIKTEIGKSYQQVYSIILSYKILNIKFDPYVSFLMSCSFENFYLKITYYESAVLSFFIS